MNTIVKSKPPVSLSKIERALASAKTTDDVQEVIAAANALAAWAKSIRDFEMGTKALELKLRAERRLGEMIIDQGKRGLLSKGGTPYKRPSSTGSMLIPVENRGPTLTEAGINKRQAQNARTLARMKSDIFEDYVQMHVNGEHVNLDKIARKQRETARGVEQRRIQLLMEKGFTEPEAETERRGHVIPSMPTRIERMSIDLEGMLRYVKFADNLTQTEPQLAKLITAANALLDATQTELAQRKDNAYKRNQACTAGQEDQECYRSDKGNDNYRA